MDRSKVTAALGAAAVCVWATGACDDPADDLYLPIYVAEGVDDPSMHLESIEGVWGIEVREVPPSPCTLTLHPRPPGGIDECQRDPTNDDVTFLGCQRGNEVFCHPYGDVCAHEVGHVAGLNHRETDGNVMTPGMFQGTGRALPEQVRAVEGLALGYAICRGVLGE